MSSTNAESCLEEEVDVEAIEGASKLSRKTLEIWGKLEQSRLWYHIRKIENDCYCIEK